MTDIDRAFFKKAKAASDELARIRNGLECKRRMLAIYTDSWVKAEEFKFHDADEYYHKKHGLEVEIRQLEMAEKAQLRKVQSYVNS